jgi:hypothetical protein
VITVAWETSGVRRLEASGGVASVLAATDVPVQYFQSVITIELAVAGALLWQMRYFEPRRGQRDDARLPDARLRLGLALVMGATVFGSLWAIADEGPKWAAIAVMLGLSISVVPILVRVLPPLRSDAETNKRDPDFWITVAALLGYVAIVGLTLLVLDTD